MRKEKFVNLTKEESHPGLVGYQVTIGLKEEGPSSSGKIKKFRETGMDILVGNKVKFFEWQPENIVLKVYQFELGIQLVPESELEQQVKPEKKSPKKKPKTPKKIVWS